MLTKVLSPFDDSVDKNPVVRSVILKLLLKYRWVSMVTHGIDYIYICFLNLYQFFHIYLNCILWSFDEVKEYLQQHLMAIEQSIILEDKDKTELYCLYINCLEVDVLSKALVGLQVVTLRCNFFLTFHCVTSPGFHVWEITVQVHCRWKSIFARWMCLPDWLPSITWSIYFKCCGFPAAVGQSAYRPGYDCKPDCGKTESCRYVI